MVVPYTILVSIVVGGYISLPCKSSNDHYFSSFFDRFLVLSLPSARQIMYAYELFFLKMKIIRLIKNLEMKKIFEFEFVHNISNLL